MYRYRLLIVLLFAGALASLYSDDLRILVPKSTSSIPFFELEAEDSKDNTVPGAEVSVEVFANHVQALARLLSGDVDMLFTGSSVGWGNHLDGGPMILLGTGVWGVSSLVGKDQGFEDFDDLRGKTVAVPFPGSPLDLQLRYIFKAHGIDPDKDLEFVYSPFPQTAAQILGGQVDAAPLPEPLATALVIGKGLSRYIRVQDAWAEVSGGDPLSPQVSLFAIPGSMDEFSAAIPALLKAWRVVSAAVSENPDVFAARYAETLGQPVPVVDQAIRNTIFQVPSVLETKNRVQQYIEATASDGGLPTDSFYYLP